MLHAAPAPNTATYTAWLSTATSSAHHWAIVSALLTSAHSSRLTLTHLASAAAAAASSPFDDRITYLKGASHAAWQDMTAALHTLLSAHGPEMALLPRHQLLQLFHSTCSLGLSACAQLTALAISAVTGSGAPGSAAECGQLVGDCARVGQPLRRSELAVCVAALAGPALLELQPAELVAALWGLVKYK